LPKRHLDATDKLRLGSYDHIALELPGNPLQLQRDELVFEKSETTRTAAILGNVSGTNLCMIDVAGKFGRELAASGEKAMVSFALDWLAGLFGTDVKKAVKRSAATQWNNDPWALGAFSAAAPGGQWARAALAEPVRDRLFFAGEATHETLWGTVGGGEERPYPRSTPPVRLATSATILAATASISGSVKVFSRGCSVTAMAIDFLSGSMPAPS
jgi:hypothetical protein